MTPDAVRTVHVGRGSFIVLRRSAALAIQDDSIIGSPLEGLDLQFGLRSCEPGDRHAIW